MPEHRELSVAAIQALVKRQLWQRREGAPLGLVVLMRVLRHGYAVARDLSDRELTLRAMSLVYTTLLSLVPLLAISFSILKGFGVHNQMEPFLENALAPLGPRGHEMALQIVAFVENVRVGVLGSVGFALLFYTVVSLMQKIESAFNSVWEIAQQRSVGEQFRDYLSVVLVGPVLVFASIGMSATIMSTPIMSQIASIQPFGWLIDFIGRLLPTAMVVAAFTFIYLFIPNTRVRLGPAFAGGFVAGVMWNAVGWLFAMFVAGASKYTALYSGFATPIVFMIWLYVGWVILLLGASIAFYQQHPEFLAGRHVTSNLSMREKESLALMITCLIGERYYHDQPPFSASQLAEELKVSGIIVKHVSALLQRGGLIIASGGDPVVYVPARPWEETSVHRVLEAVRTGDEEGSVPGVTSASYPVIDSVLEEVESASRSAVGSMSLKDLAKAREPESARREVQAIPSRSAPV